MFKKKENKPSVMFFFTDTAYERTKDLKSYILKETGKKPGKVDMINAIIENLSPGQFDEIANFYKKAR